MAGDFRCQQFATAFPGGEDGEGNQGDAQREPAALGNLDGVGGEVGKIDDEEAADGQHHQRFRPFPAQHQHEGNQQGVDHHGAGDGNAVGRSQVAGILEGQYQKQHAYVQRPVGQRDVNLSLRLIGGLVHRHAWQKAHLYRLVGDRERAGNHRLRGNHRGGGRQQHHGDLGPTGGQQEEGAADVVRVIQQHRALTEVVQHQCR